MFHAEPITTLDRPELAPYRTLRRQHEHRERGIFVAEGEKVVRRLLESSLAVESLLLPEKCLAGLEPLLNARPAPVRVFVGDKALLETLTGFSMYQGWLAVGRVPAPRSLEDLLAAAARPRLFVAVDGLSSGENVGAVVRNCAAFRVDALIVGETSASPYLRRAVRSSMGMVFQLPVLESTDLVATLGRLSEQGVMCVAAHPHAAGRALEQAPLTADGCVVLGSEGLGLSPAVLAACSVAAAIPMPSGVDSLNVASAAAVFLYEVQRQRGNAPGQPGCRT